MLPLIVLADANILVKDVVSSVFYDLAKAKAIDLRWTPQIEAEYAKHRARLRAQADDREVTLEDLVWAQNRLMPIKKYLVPNFLPPEWDANGDRLDKLRNDEAWAPLLQLSDADDVHVALAAADWAKSTGRNVVLVTENLKDLPGKVLEPFGVYPLHPGDVLYLAYQADPEGVSKSLQKTAADFKNPAFSLADMLWSISSPQQFDNKELAEELALQWEVAEPIKVKSAKNTKPKTK
jgi:hypothetical protein